MSVSSTMRQYSRQYCDFVFPKEIPRPFKKSLSKNNKNEPKKEVEQNEKQIIKKYTSNIQRTLRELRKYKKEYLTDKLHEYSPKMKKMLENIKKYPGIHLVYSDFKTLSGVGIFEIVLRST